MEQGRFAADALPQVWVEAAQNPRPPGSRQVPRSPRGKLPSSSLTQAEALWWTGGSLGKVVKVPSRSQAPNAGWLCPVPAPVKERRPLFERVISVAKKPATPGTPRPMIERLRPARCGHLPLVRPDASTPQKKTAVLPKSPPPQPPMWLLSSHFELADATGPGLEISAPLLAAVLQVAPAERSGSARSSSVRSGSVRSSRANLSRTASIQSTEDEGTSAESRSPQRKSSLGNDRFKPAAQRAMRMSVFSRAVSLNSITGNEGLGTLNEADGAETAAVNAATTRAEETKSAKCRGNLRANVFRRRGKKERMIYLEAIARQARRAEALLRTSFSMWSRYVEAYRQLRKEFGQDYVDSVRLSFSKYASKRGELLSRDATFCCLQDVGLAGSNHVERRSAWAQIVSVLADSKVPEGEGISLSQLVFSLMPGIRDDWQRFYEGELQHRLAQLPVLVETSAAQSCPEGHAPLDRSTRAARLIGVDPLSFIKCVDELNPSGPVKKQQEVGRSVVHDDEEDLDEISMPDFGVGRTVSVQLAARALVKCRERTARALRKREVVLKDNLRLTDMKIMRMRPQLLDLHDRFHSYLESSEPSIRSGGATGHMLQSQFASTLTSIERELIPPCLRELGIRVHSRIAQHILSAEEQGTGMTFPALLKILEDQDVFRKVETSERTESIFGANCRTGDGTISVAEAALALTQLGLLPRRQEEQVEIVTLLVEAGGFSPEGRIAFSDFEMLCLRANERLTMLEFEAGLEFGVLVGLTQQQVSFFWEAFLEEQKCDGRPPTKQVALVSAPDSAKQRQAFKVETEQREEPEDPSLARSGQLDLTQSAEQPESLGAANPPSSHVTPGERLDALPVPAKGFASSLMLSGVSENIAAKQPLLRSNCRKMASKWSSVVLRRALRLLRLPSNYVQSLEHSKLASVLGEYVGVTRRPTDEENDLRGEIGSTLCAGTPEELYRKVHALGFRFAQELGWEVAPQLSQEVQPTPKTWRL